MTLGLTKNDRVIPDWTRKSMVTKVDDNTKIAEPVTLIMSPIPVLNSMEG